jgi:hypothetical protein
LLTAANDAIDVGRGLAQANFDVDRQLPREQLHICPARAGFNRHRGKRLQLLDEGLGRDGELQQRLFRFSDLPLAFRRQVPGGRDQSCPITEPPHNI